MLWRDGLVMLECVFSLLSSALLCGFLCPHITASGVCQGALFAGGLLAPEMRVPV